MARGAGKLRYRVSVYTVALSKNSIGQAKESLVYMRDEYAAIRDLSIHEQVSSGSLQSELKTEITMRYNTDIGAGHVLRYGNVDYEIEGQPMHDPRRRWTQFHCKSGVARRD